MKLRYGYQFIFSIAFLSLVAGTVNYLLFRPDIILFKFTGISFTAYSIKNNFILNFLTGYFSDMAWCIALCCIAFNDREPPVSIIPFGIRITIA